MRLKDILIPVFTIIVLIVSGCLEISVDRRHPNHGAVGTSFSGTTEVIFRKDGGIDATDDRAMLFAVHKPVGWTIDSITYISPEHGTGVFTYLGNAADEADDNPGGIDTGWEDSLQAASPADTLMHWQVYVSDQDTTSASTADDPDTFHVTVNYTLDNVEGNYKLKYWTSHTNSDLAWDTAEENPKTAVTEKYFGAYDPSTSPLVSLTINDGSWMLEDVKFKGVLSGWALFNGFDDGTNGDSVAGDHIWTGQHPILTDGTYEWGAIEDDGTTWGQWLLAGFPNAEVTVSGTTVSGQTNFSIAPDSAVSAGTVIFTVHDSNGDYVNGDIRWKGAPWWDNRLTPMNDLGTDGDAVAGDSIWSVTIDSVAAGTFGWGAVNWDGSSSGEWLIDPSHGGNPTYTLDADLVTLHGETDYVIPKRLFQDITRSILFQVDMTEWLDEEGSDGYRVFNVARDEMQVRGSFNDWGDCTECTMTRTPGTNIFSHAINVTAQPNTNHEFSYYMHLSEVSLDSISARYGMESGDSTLAPVDYIGWGTSPREQGNFKFNLGGLSDDGTPLALELKAYYEIYPGHVIPDGHSMDLEFTIDMSTHADFNGAEDSLYIRTHDKWLNFVQGWSNGMDLNHYTTSHNPDGPTMNDDGTYSMTFDIVGPQNWFIYYKWGYLDASTGAEVNEEGGGLGGVPRIRYIHQDAGDGCAWPDQFSFPTDGPFAETEDLVVIEPWDSSAICIVFASNDEMQNTVPVEYFISDNYPNPFNPTTKMEFSLPQASDISFKVYSLIGAEVYSYSKKALSAGRYTIQWNGRNFNNSPVPSGVYIYEFRAGDSFRQTKKMTLLK